MPPRDADQLTRVVLRFAENVVALRRRSAITQEDAAGAAGLHRTEISLLERGLRVPGLDTIVRVAAGVQAEPCELLAGMAWRIDPNRLHGAKPPAGNFEVALGSRWEEVR
jgi:transcriptional regulator with XRE-family HTH domain